MPSARMFRRSLQPAIAAEARAWWFALWLKAVGALSCRQVPQRRAKLILFCILLMERIFRFPIKVGKESIDVLGHTNNKEYLRWMEEAALAHSDSLGWTMGRYLKIGKVFVASTS